MRRLSAGGVPLLLMCYFLSAALCPFCCLPGRAEAAQPTSRQSSSADQLQHSKKLTGEGAERLEASLLNMFGLKKRPRPRREAINVPEFLIELYRHQTGLEVDTTNFDLRGKLTQTANTVRTFAHEEDEGSERDDDAEGQQEVRLRFDLSSIPAEEALKAAELRLYRGGSAPASGTRTAEGRRDQAQSSGEGRRSQEADKCRRHWQSGEDGAPAPVTTSTTSADGGCHRGVQRENAGKRRRKDKQQQILIHEIVRPDNQSRRGHEEPILRLLDTRIVDTGHQGWETFDVLPALLRWREEPHRNYGLLIQVRPLAPGHPADSQHFHLRRPARRRRHSLDSSDGQLEQEVRPSEHLWASQQPLLVTYTDDGKARSRSKRAAEKKHKRKGRRDNCRRHSLYVDFSDVGWNDWIVAPPGYQAFYCHGDCPYALPDHLNTTNHAIVQTLVHSVNPGAVPRACCVPTELSSISMLYIDEYDKVVLKNYHDMVVEACGCR